jgi:hypothetical protein
VLGDGVASPTAVFESDSLSVVVGVEFVLTVLVVAVGGGVFVGVVARCGSPVTAVCHRTVIPRAASTGAAAATVLPMSPLQCRLSPGAKALLVAS